MDEDDMKLEHYIEIGAVTIEGIDESGEFIFSISEKAQEIAPELWQAHEEYTERALLDLYEKDLITIEYDENLEATINISPEGMELARQYGLIDQMNIDDIPND